MKIINILKKVKREFEKVSKYREFIKEKTGHDIIKVNNLYKKDLIILDNHIKTYVSKHKQSFLNINHSKKGLKIEKGICDYLNTTSEFTTETPVSNKGRTLSVGYPDALLKSKNFMYYLEIKSLNINTINSTARTFYDNVSDEWKITESLPHLLISFIFKNDVLVDYKIIDVYDFDIKLKAEINTSNKYMYNDKNHININKL